MFEQRLHFTDPDYRRDPKTDRFCALCQRDLKEGASVVRALQSGQEACCIVHPDDAIEGDFEVLVGPECAKKVPAEFRLAAS